jgi:hypothetical protein
MIDGCNELSEVQGYALCIRVSDLDVGGRTYRNSLIVKGHCDGSRRSTFDYINPVGCNFAEAAQEAIKTA